MDRLEKALSKSRQQRAALCGEAPLGARAEPLAPPAAPPSATNDAFLESNRVIAHRAGLEADVYRQLRTKVLRIMNDSGFKTLAITSPRYGDGKTTAVTNLGISIALDQKQTVLLVDLDIRNPNLHQYLGLKPKAGLTDYLLRNTPIPECLMRPPFERVNVLPAGMSLENSSELLGSHKMIALAHELKARYPDRFVIYDMPPVLEQDDALAFLPQVDAVLVVVRDGVTRAEDLKRALKALSGSNVIGTVLNNCW